MQINENKFNLESLNPCKTGAIWVAAQSSYQSAWETCDRGDWMLWIAKQRRVDSRKFAGAKSACARLVVHLMTDKRSVDAVVAAERFAKGEVSVSELEIAAKAANDAIRAVEADLGWMSPMYDDIGNVFIYAADAAFCAAFLDDIESLGNIYGTPPGNDTAIMAAQASAEVVYNTSEKNASDVSKRAHSERKRVLKECANLIREHISFKDLRID